MNFPQYTIVVTPIRDANTPTGTKPPLTVCQAAARAARRKKYAPPRYAEPSIIAVIVGLIRQAKRRPVSSGHGYRTAKATTRNGTIAYATPRVSRSTRSSATVTATSWADTADLLAVSGGDSLIVRVTGLGANRPGGGDQQPRGRVDRRSRQRR